jgi:hypothetical protein
MRRIDFVPLVHGIVGGVLAGTVVALWFLALDFTAGEPLRTPIALAQALFGDAVSVTASRLLVSYTLLHFATFALLGGATALLLRAMQIPAGLVVGFVVGVGLLNSVYYGALLVAGVNLGTLLPGTHVIAANLIGGMVLIAYLHHAMDAPNPLGLAYIWRQPLLADGVLTGLVGAGTVALWFLLFDLLSGTPFFTPAALGSFLFLGVTSPAEIQVSVVMVAAYTLLHVAAFALVGVGFVWVANQLVLLPGLWLVTFMAFVIVELVFLLGVGGVVDWVLGPAGWLAVAMGNLLAVTAMGTWLWSTHSGLRRRFVETPVETML